VYNVFITNQFQTTFAQGGRGEVGENLLEATVNSKEAPDPGPGQNFQVTKTKIFT
jgi:hypothetical protein